MNAYILAGGKSSRMGEDKGLALLHAKPLVSYILAVVSCITPDIFIVTSNDEYAQFNFPLLPDSVPHLGPAGAIDTALQHSCELQNLILPCDMPYIDEASLRSLICQSVGSEICTPMYQQYPEALMGIYYTSCAKKWHLLVAQGILKLSDLLSHFTTTFVNGDEMSEKNKHLFVNINSKDILATYNRSTMKILVFGSLCDIVGQSIIEIEAVENTTLLLQKLATTFPLLKEKKFAISVNKKIVVENMTLQSHAEIALLPPFSGG